LPCVFTPAVLPSHSEGNFKAALHPDSQPMLRFSVMQLSAPTRFVIVFPAVTCRKFERNPPNPTSSNGLIFIIPCLSKKIKRIFNFFL